MNISSSESNYIAFGKIGMNFEWTIADDEPMVSILGCSVVSEYTIGENHFADLIGSYSTINGCPISQFTFCEGTRILGFSSSMETTIPELENLVLEQSFRLGKKSNEFQQYKLDTGLRDFSYSGDHILVYPKSKVPPSNEIKMLLQKLFVESSPKEGILVLEKLLQMVEKILVVSTTYERCYILAKDMNASLKWLSEICSQCKVGFIKSSIDSFPAA